MTLIGRQFLLSAVYVHDTSFIDRLVGRGTCIGAFQLTSPSHRPSSRYRLGEEPSSNGKGGWGARSNDSEQKRVLGNNDLNKDLSHKDSREVFEWRTSSQSKRSSVFNLDTFDQHSLLEAGERLAGFDEFLSRCNLLVGNMLIQGKHALEFRPSVRDIDGDSIASDSESFDTAPTEYDNSETTVTLVEGDEPTKTDGCTVPNEDGQTLVQLNLMRDIENLLEDLENQDMVIKEKWLTIGKHTILQKEIPVQRESLTAMDSGLSKPRSTAPSTSPIPTPLTIASCISSPSPLRSEAKPDEMGRKPPIVMDVATVSALVVPLLPRRRQTLRRAGKDISDASHGEVFAKNA